MKGGQWKVALYLDERGNDEQRTALQGIFSGAESSEVCVLACMSLAARLPDERLARRALGCLAYGDPPWAPLSWLLLGIDGPAIRQRRHESPLDCRSRRSRGNRKTCAKRRGRCAGPGRRNDWRRCRKIGLGFAVLRLVCNEWNEQPGTSAFGATQT
jgi:hypothetical protein